MKQNNSPPTDDDSLSAETTKRYDPKRLWQKITDHAKQAGREVVNYTLQLHYAAQRPGTPAWAKRTAYGAIAYFILPLDAVPDFMAGVGYTDDLGALALAVSTLATYIDDEVRSQSREQLDRWFGPAETATKDAPHSQQTRH